MTLSGAERSAGLVEQAQKLLHGQPAVPQDRAECSDSHVLVPVNRDRGTTAIRVTQDMVTAANANYPEVGLLQGAVPAISRASNVPALNCLPAS